MVPEFTVPDPASVHNTLPDASVVRTPLFALLVQLAVPIRNPPALILMPPSKDEVALVVDRIDPPVTTMPWDEERPAVVSPPEKVEVEVLLTVRFVAVVEPKKELMFWARILPPVMVRPFEEERPLVAMPPAKVEVPTPRAYRRPLVVADWEKREGPLTEKVVEGVEVPTPTRPLSVTVNRVVLAMSETRNAVDEVDPLAHTVSLAGAVEVPMARKFWVGSTARKSAELKVVVLE